MFEFVRKHNRWLQALLLVLILPSFVALGVQGYSGFLDDSAQSVASVDGQRITQAEWDYAHRQYGERARQQAPDLDARLLDSPEAKQATLEGLIQERVLTAAAQHQHLEVSKERLEGRFAHDPQMAVARLPNGGVNKTVLAAQGMTVENFAARYRQDLRSRQVVAPVQQQQAAGGDVAANLAFDALLQRRAVRVQVFNPAAQTAAVSVTDAEVAAFYQTADTQKRWQRPESAQIEYLVLDAAALKGNVQVSEADLRSFYEQNASRFSAAEERRARHILLKLDDKAPQAEQTTVRSKIDNILAQARKAPDQFAALAKAHSQDEGSAPNGGDLDYFARGAMTKAFEDAAFALKPGEISSPVRTEFGWHIIKLEAIRGGEKRPFDAVRAEIEDEQRTQRARQRYQELAETFSTMVFEQPDSLAPVAQKLGLAIQRGTVQRQPQPGLSGPLASPKLLEAVFASDSVRSKRNTDAIETGPNQLVSARVLQHQAAAAPPLAEVKEAVRQQLVLQRAAALAKKAGEARLAQGVAGSDEGLAALQWISRAKPDTLPPAVLDAVMRADAHKLPALLGVDQGQAGYWIIKLEQVGAREPDAVPADAVVRQYSQAWGQAEARTYLNALKHAVKAKQTAARPSAAASHP